MDDQVVEGVERGVCSRGGPVHRAAALRCAVVLRCAARSSGGVAWRGWWVRFGQ